MLYWQCKGAYLQPTKDTTEPTAAVTQMYLQSATLQQNNAKRPEKIE